MTSGRVNPKFTLDDQGITGLGTVYYNLMEPALVEAALNAGEAVFRPVIDHGKATGPAPKGKALGEVAHRELGDEVGGAWWEDQGHGTFLPE